LCGVHNRQRTNPRTRDVLDDPVASRKLILARLQTLRAPPEHHPTVETRARK
jgi:hypothetical protein